MIKIVFDFSTSQRQEYFSLISLKPMWTSLSIHQNMLQ
uniref:Uncharacterized protein n=1 Tax=Ascaris lumbricoides TaxID=6252 RepID=A0A0M3ID62_ASCLU